MARIAFSMPINTENPTLGLASSETQKTTLTDAQGQTITKVVQTDRQTLWKFPFTSWAEKLITFGSTFSITQTTMQGNDDPVITETSINGDYTVLLEGKFRFFDDTKPYVKSGTVSKIDILYRGSRWITVTESWEDVHTILSFFNASDTNGLLTYLMGGSDTILLSPGGDTISTFGGNDTVRGAAGNDRIFTNEGDDSIWGDAGNDTIDGGQGLDIVHFGGPRSAYTVSATSVFGPDGNDTITNCERLVFADQALALDTYGNPGKAYRLYQAAFDRVPDLPGLGYWITQLDRGMDLIEAAARFVNSQEFRNLYGEKPTTTQFLTKLYHHVLHRDPDPSGLAWWENAMATDPSKTMAKVLADFSESPENHIQVAGAIAGEIHYIPWG